MKVTVGIPFYNAGKDFHTAIASVLNQTHQNIELILVNDGSTDESLSIAQSFSDKRITIIDDKLNKGLPARLNQIIDLAQGEYIARMDADDVISADRISKQVKRLEEICKGTAQAFGAKAKLDYEYGYPPTVNHPNETSFALQVASEISGEDNVEGDALPIMAAEDFAYMLEKRPGAYLNVGQGDSAALHNPEYDFNDELSPIGASFFVKLVETAQPLD